MEDISIVKLFKRYIRNTEEKAPVVEHTVTLCKLTNAVKMAGNFPNHKVYVTTIALKHLYDRRPAEEFNAILKYLKPLVEFPDQIYEAKAGKRGDFCFVKKFRYLLYLCSIEKTNDRDPEEPYEGMNYVVTVFRLRKGKESYLNHYRLIWSWKDGIPSS